MKLNRVLIAAASLSLVAGCSQAGQEPARTDAAQETSAAAAGTESAEDAQAVGEEETADSGEEDAPDYSQTSSWAYLETDVEGKDADIFFVCPSVYGGSDDACNMSVSDVDTNESFVGAINME